MYIVIVLLKGLANAAYALLKLFPVKYRVCFFSRQSDTVTVDFRLIETELKKRDKAIKTVMICHRFRNRQDGAARYAWALVRSMYYLAASRVCVIDGYWPTVSILKHRKSLKVVQIWHSLGKIKQSGYQTMDRTYGRPSKLARVMRMHRNYDYIIAGGKAWNPYYCAAFDVKEDKLRNYGLPRLDEILRGAGSRERFEEKYPELRGKTIVLYAPTYRNHKLLPPYELAELFRSEKYALICRFHPNQKFTCDLPAEMTRYAEEDIFEYLQICDYFITDYSSLALEAAALRKKTLYYLFDHEQYMENNGINLDLLRVMPHCSFRTPAPLYEVIEAARYPEEELEAYRAQYLPEQMGSSTALVVDLIEEILGNHEIRDNGGRKDETVGIQGQPVEVLSADRK